MPKFVVSLIAAAVIAVGSFFAFDLPVNDAISIALDSDKAIAACERLLTADEVEGPVAEVTP